MIVVSDTSPITNLAAIAQLDLLQQLYTSLIIPTAVYNEMVEVDKVVPGAVEVQTLSWIETQAVADAQRVTDLQTSQENIDLGEAEAIILAVELKAELLLLMPRLPDFFRKNLVFDCQCTASGLLLERCNRIHQPSKPAICFAAALRYRQIGDYALDTIGRLARSVLQQPLVIST